MHLIHPAVGKLCRTAARASRGFAVAVCTLTLAGCYTAQERLAPADFDYRLRHNIAIKEGPRTVELFIGSSRGGLSGEQRADVLAFANAWRREATGAF
jgi:pilus assembly protein CpaD